jgi:hypothetical protein
MMTARAYARLGPFDETHRFTHDYDYWLRALRCYDFHYLDEALVYYRVHDAMGSRLHEPTILQEIQRLRRKHRFALWWLMAREWLRGGR